MRIRDRLLTAFLITILLPILLITVFGTVILRKQNSSMERMYNLENGAVQLVQSPIRILDSNTRDIFSKLQQVASDSPELLTQADYLDSVNQELQERSSYLMVRQGDQLLYQGNQGEDSLSEEALPEYHGSGNWKSVSYYVPTANKGYLLKQEDFLFPNQQRGSFFIVSDLDVLLPQTRELISQILLALGLVLCITAVLLTYWIYSSMIRPINELRRAAKELQEGNLDYSIKNKKQDEIGLLCQDFERMRLRLKDTIEKQLQYEEDTMELLGSVSHDLKTPLTAIKGYTEGLMDGIPGTPERQEKYLRTIYSKADDMTHLVDELVDFTRIESDAMAYHFVEVDAEQFFLDCIEDIRLDLEMKHIKVQYENQAKEDLKVIADPEQLKRVIHNIVGNSQKYLDKPEGFLLVRTVEDGEFLQVSIQDNGKGIAEEELSRVFERFYRADASRNSAEGGTGLGLSIAKKIIDDHGGRIWAESTPGEGTTIFFTLRKVDETGTEDLPHDGGGKHKMFSRPLLVFLHRDKKS